MIDQPHPPADDEENIELEEQDSEDVAFAELDLRLEDFVVGYFEQAERLHIELAGKDVVGVINDSLDQLGGDEPRGPEDDSPKAYFLDGMKEDLLGFADSFQETPEGDDSGTFQPMSTATWAVCLQRLRETVERLGREEGL